MRVLQALALAAPAAQAAAAAPKPHLIYLLADDYGWANVGFHAADMHTPNIDRLATEQRASSSAGCTPTASVRRLVARS